MDISVIEQAIQSLENDVETYDNVSELASLYIVYNNLKPSLNSISTSVEDELRDILPSYHKYLDSKKRYQLGKTNEGEVIHNLKLLGAEISDFLLTLYSGTDMRKERIYIIEEIGKIYKKLTE